jgi:hypothetical protein
MITNCDRNYSITLNQTLATLANSSSALCFALLPNHDKADCEPRPSLADLYKFLAHHASRMGLDPDQLFVAYSP